MSLYMIMLGLVYMFIFWVYQEGKFYFNSWFQRFQA
jgi:hypothetical protein